VADEKAFGDYAWQALFGRSEDRIAAACKEAGMNALGLHVCCVGNFDLTPPPQALLDRLCERVVEPWMRRYGILAERIIGHRDAGLMAGFDWRQKNAAGIRQYKSCPGERFDLDAVRRMVR